MSIATRLLPEPGSPVWDVDFFWFTGLTPGTEFTARTTDPGGTGIDTILGWFSAGGALLESDDQSGGGNLSLLTGTVPAGGALTFAVTGYDDFDFVGAHGEEGSYSLVLEIDAGVIEGDYNDDGIVDAVDYTVWRNNLGDPTEADINNAGNGTGGVTSADYTWWKQRYGNTFGAGGIAGVLAPEPSGMCFACWEAYWALAQDDRLLGANSDLAWPLRLEFSTIVGTESEWMPKSSATDSGYRLHERTYFASRPVAAIPSSRRERTSGRSLRNCSESP